MAGLATLTATVGMAKTAGLRSLSRTQRTSPATPDTGLAAGHRLGHDTTHGRLLGLSGHTDDEVMTLAMSEDRVQPLVIGSTGRYRP